jgi:hypothetical protein
MRSPGVAGRVISARAIKLTSGLPSPDYEAGLLPILDTFLGLRNSYSCIHRDILLPDDQIYA